MKMTFTEARVQYDGGVWFCAKVNEPALARGFVQAMKERVYDLEAKEHREKRSNDSNAYLWELLGKLAERLETTKEEIYMEKVRGYGIFKDFTLDPEDAPTFRKAWEMLGTGWPTEQVDYTPDGDRLIIRAYYGSSRYNTKQMSRLIDAVVEDCKALDIETLQPERLAAMKSEWGRDL